MSSSRISHEEMQAAQSICLRCPKARCTLACPVNTNIASVVGLFREGKLHEAGKLLFDNNPLSAVCSIVCPHEKMCEGSCVVGIKKKPVEVGKIEHFISEAYLDEIENPKPIQKGKKVAIIGSGPAGLTIAINLALEGYDITIFEANERIGGVLQYGIPGFRLPKSLLDKYEALLYRLGVKIRFNTLIGPYITIDQLFLDGYRAVFIGTGVWKPNTMGIPGESLGHVHYAIDYLKSPSRFKLGKNVLVIGGGNVAIDAARTAKRLGSEVTLAYRKTKEEMPARDIEVDDAEKDGVNFAWLLSPISINDSEVKFAVNTLTGNGSYEPSEDIVIMEADSVLVAVSQGPRSNIVQSAPDISTDKKGLITASENGETSRPGVFASGDIVTGAKTVVHAVAWSKQVVQAIMKYVDSQAGS